MKLESKQSQASMRCRAAVSSILPIDTPRARLGMGAQRPRQLKSFSCGLRRLNAGSSHQRRWWIRDERAPNRHSVGGRSKVLKAQRAAGIRFPKQGGTRDIDVTDHLVMNIAPKHDQSFALESHRWMPGPFIQRQLEFLGG